MTSPDFEKRLSQYADVLIQVGLNVQPGQKLVITGAPFEAANLVRLITARAYQVGASLVEVEWLDEHLNLIRLQNANPETLDVVSQWRYDGLAEEAEKGAAFMRLSAPDPDLLAGQDPDAVMTVMRAAMQARKRYSDIVLSEKSASWLVAAAPSTAWNTKVFADIDPAERDAVAWDTIFDISRISGDNPVAGWWAHAATLEARASHMTERAYQALHLKGPGTDLTIGLADNHIWIGGASTLENGVKFTANIPTEEIFTAPRRDGLSGVVSTTKPLNYGGSLIEDITLTFEEGRVVKASARTGEDVLHKMLEVDEGASRLGEIALVPHSSPISQTGRIFYSGLIDENASCHMALGASYPINLKGGTDMSAEEREAEGLNQSISHTDIMIGSGELVVDGHTADGQGEPLMRGGEWVIDA